jgi:hypothetical protein
LDRGPGWPTVLGLILVVLTLSVVHPLQLMMLPLAMLLVALPPRRVSLLLFAALLAVLSFAAPRGPLWAVERGWTLVLGACFVGSTLLWPSSSFLVRGLMATGGAAALAGTLIGLVGGWAELDWMIASNYREMAEMMAANWPGGLADAAEVVDLAATLPARLFPGFLGVASLAALGVGWWGYRRLSRTGSALGRLTEFRFPDALVWILIAGLALVLLPLAGWGERLGSNLLFFMGALYALRGLGVLVALVIGMTGPQLPVLLVLAVVGVLLYPIVVAGTVLLGVTDTWLDLRSGRSTANDEG